MIRQRVSYVRPPMRRLISCSASKLSPITTSGTASTPPFPSHLAASHTACVSAATSSSPTNLVNLDENGPRFLQNLSTKDLACYTLLSAMTSTPGLVRLSTKLMKYTPQLLIKNFVYPIYCGGETFEEVIETGTKLYKRGFGNMMISYSVEDAEGASTSSLKAQNNLLKDAVNQITLSINGILGKHWDNVNSAFQQEKVSSAPIAGYIALKPTGLMMEAQDILKNYDQPEYREKWDRYLDECRKICRHAAETANGKVVIVFDAEKKVLQPGVYEAQRVMMREFNRDGNVVVIGTIQMYLQDSLQQLEYELTQAKLHNYQVGMKLVRGAYIHSEPDRKNVIHKTKQDTDHSYNKGVSVMLDSIISGWKQPGKGPIDGVRSEVGRLIVASHNEESMAIADNRIRAEAPANFDLTKDESVVFGQLMGMAEDQGEELAKRGHKVVKYVPWGPAKETKEYLMRRLEENGDTVNVGGWTFVKYCMSEFTRRLTGAGVAR